jgi:hypothetical protein
MFNAKVRSFDNIVTNLGMLVYHFTLLKAVSTSLSRTGVEKQRFNEKKQRWKGACLVNVEV